MPLLHKKARWREAEPLTGTSLKLVAAPLVFVFIVLEMFTLGLADSRQSPSNNISWSPLKVYLLVPTLLSHTHKL